MVLLSSVCSHPMGMACLGVVSLRGSLALARLQVGLSGVAGASASLPSAAVSERALPSRGRRCGASAVLPWQAGRRGPFSQRLALFLSCDGAIISASGLDGRGAPLPNPAVKRDGLKLRFRFPSLRSGRPLPLRYAP